jgi:hypothetical protein
MVSMSKQSFEKQAREIAAGAALEQALRVKPKSREAALKVLAWRGLPREILTAEARRTAWIQAQGRSLAAKARLRHDERGFWARGDHLRVAVLDYVAPYAAKGAPFLDSGGEGLALVRVYRKRVYAGSCKWGPSEREDVYFVGRNEAGTYFAHPVPKTYTTVLGALAWIWQGYYPIERQGDLAIAAGRGPRLPRQLPSGHRVEGQMIVHQTHNPLPVPEEGAGLRVIVGRRLNAPAVLRD